MAGLKKYLEQLRSLPAEAAIEPDLKPDRQKQDKKIRRAAELERRAFMLGIRVGWGPRAPASR